MSNDIESLVNAAVEKALGGSSDSKPQPTATPSQPAPQRGESSLDKVARLMEMQLTMQLAEKTAAYQPPGAPARVVDESNPYSWDKATIERLQRDGTFKGKVENAMGVGNRGLFRKGAK